jgi:V8-like Glu-specific endopeptidase
VSTLTALGMQADGAGESSSSNPSWCPIMATKTTHVQSGRPPKSSTPSSLPAMSQGADTPVQTLLTGEQRSSAGNGTVLDLFATSATFNGSALTETSRSGEPSVIHDAWALGRGSVLEPLSVMEAKLAEAIIGKDDRVQVPDPMIYPFRCICSLRLRTQSGLWGAGTGWLVGPRTVITAGHCLFLHEHGGWIAEMEVYPARQADFKPFTAAAQYAMTVAGWKEDALPESDYGAVWLDRDVTGFGSFGYAALDAGLLETLRCQVVGYPSDKQGTMWGHARHLMQVLDKQLEYDIDTIDGNSGGPVFVIHEGSAIAIGIHNYGNSVSMRNTATRLTKPVFANIQRWCTAP